VLFLPTGRMFQMSHPSQTDHSTEKFFGQLLASDLLVVDAFGLRRLSV
jgi:hypothetical protein